MYYSFMLPARSFKVLIVLSQRIQLNHAVGNVKKIALRTLACLVIHSNSSYAPHRSALMDFDVPQGVRDPMAPVFPPVAVYRFLHAEHGTAFT